MIRSHCCRRVLANHPRSSTSTYIYLRFHIYQRHNRSLSTLRRPNIFSSTSSPSSCCSMPYPASAATSQSAQPSTTATSTATSADILPRISSHPALRSIQVRCGPRATYRPCHRIRKRRHGFLARLKSRGGRKIIKRRRAKGRASISH